MGSNTRGIVGYSFGAWDLLHVDHIRQLKAAKAQCDWLIVGVFTDEVVESFKRKPIIPLRQRIEMLRALRCVDFVAVQRSRNPTSNILRHRPDILFHGDDWDEIPGAKAMYKMGGGIITPPYGKRQSTSKIIQTIIERYHE